MTDEERQRLQNMAAEILAIADPQATSWSCSLQKVESAALLHAMACLEIAKRRVRSPSMPLKYFGEPAWNILLELYDYTCRGKRISITGVCEMSLAAPTTALRYISALEKDGFIKRIEDCEDSRRSWVELTEKGASRIEAALSAMAAVEERFHEMRADKVQHRAS